VVSQRIEAIDVSTLLSELKVLARLGYGPSGLSPEVSPELLAAVVRIDEGDVGEPTALAHQVQTVLTAVLSKMKDRPTSRAASFLLRLDREMLGLSFAQRDDMVAQLLGNDDNQHRRSAQREILTQVALAIAKTAEESGRGHRPIARRLLSGATQRRSLPLSNIPLTDLAGARGAVDPAKYPDEYTELLLGMAGSVDPDDIQKATLSDLAPLEAVDDDRLRHREADTEWSVIEVLGHMVDSEVNAAIRYRIILCERNPSLTSYSQDDWVHRLDHQNADVQTLLDQFEELRTANLSLWRTTLDEERARCGLHAERGPQSLETLFRMQSGHDLMHLNQIYRALAGRED
jgi:hypothetical protein